MAIVWPYKHTESVVGQFKWPPLGGSRRGLGQPVSATRAVTPGAMAAESADTNLEQVHFLIAFFLDEI